MVITSSGLTHGLVLAKTVVVRDWRLQPSSSLLAGVRVPAQPHLLLLLLAVVLHVLPQAARVGVLLETAVYFTLVRFLRKELIIIKLTEEWSQLTGSLWVCSCLARSLELENALLQLWYLQGKGFSPV